MSIQHYSTTNICRPIDDSVAETEIKCLIFPFRGLFKLNVISDLLYLIMVKNKVKRLSSMGWHSQPQKVLSTTNDDTTTSPLLISPWNEMGLRFVISYCLSPMLLYINTCSVKGSLINHQRTHTGQQWRNDRPC